MVGRKGTGGHFSTFETAIIFLHIVVMKKGCLYEIYKRPNYKKKRNLIVVEYQIVSAIIKAYTK